MADTIVVQSIHPEIKKAVIVFNIEGKTYPKVLPFLTTNDADLLKKQLQEFAKELRAEFDDLKTAVQAADANAVPQVSDSVNALVGQPIEIDTAVPADAGVTPAAPAAPADTTPADTTGQAAPADTASTDASADKPADPAGTPTP